MFSQHCDGIDIVPSYETRLYRKLNTIALRINRITALKLIV